MQQKISWPIAIVALLVAVAVAFVIGSRVTTSNNGQGQVSPEFQKLSPAEQQEALATAERLRRLRGAPSAPP